MWNMGILNSYTMEVIKIVHHLIESTFYLAS
jgi:hypothetical protein